MAKSKQARKKANAGRGLIPVERIGQSIVLVRGERILLDRDLARLYGVPVKRLNEAVKRNIDRFPADFMFQLTWDEVRNQGRNLRPYNCAQEWISL